MRVILDGLLFFPGKWFRFVRGRCVRFSDQREVEMGGIRGVLGIFFSKVALLPRNHAGDFPESCA